MSSAWSWLAVNVRALIAERRATRIARIASTVPVLGLGSPVARPAATAVAAGVGVLRVGLAAAAASGPVRPVDLEHRQPGRGQHRGQPGAVTAGALDPDPGHLAMSEQPGQQLPVTSTGRHELAVGQPPTQPVDHRDMMSIGMGVDPGIPGQSRRRRRVNTARRVDGTLLIGHGGHQPSFHLNNGQGGTHRSGRVDKTLTSAGEQAPIRSHRPPGPCQTNAGPQARGRQIPPPGQAEAASHRQSQTPGS